jgi:hypothetical protein
MVQTCPPQLLCLNLNPQQSCWEVGPNGGDWDPPSQMDYTIIQTVVCHPKSGFVILMSIRTPQILKSLI